MAIIKKTKIQEKTAAPVAEQPAAPVAGGAPAVGKEEKAAKTTRAAKAPKSPKLPKAEKAPKSIPVSKVAVIFEHQGRQMTQAQVLETVAKAHKETVKSLELYFKAEDGAVYYVLNGDITGKVEI